MVDLGPALAAPFEGIDGSAVAGLDLISGKVRDIVDLGDELAFIATDRVSAFDHVLGTVPYRGQVLNQLAAWWFEQLDDVVRSHVVAVPDPNLTIGRKCKPLPVEVVVRAYLSGSTSTALWSNYAAGSRTMYGVELPDGMTKNDRLPQAIITPTTKARAGGHDEPISEADIVAQGLVPAERWDEVRSVALAVFERGREIGDDRGLVLVDTKYEFGIDDQDRLVLIDEVHTPDSSRYWRQATASDRVGAGLEPENLDKEVIRLAYVERGYRGDGIPDPINREIAVRAAGVYVEAFEMLTATTFEPAPYPAAPRVIAALNAWRQMGDRP